MNTHLSFWHPTEAMVPNQCLRSVKSEMQVDTVKINPDKMELLVAGRRVLIDLGV